QYSLPDGSIVIPVILGSDKTMLSTFSGNRTEWPVDFCIGKRSKLNGLILIGLVPRCPNGPKTHTIKIAYQESMATMLHPLEDRAKIGIKIMCADGQTRHIYPRIALFLADYTPQRNITVVKHGCCPCCEVNPD
ncbi:hypothetical protein K440DRAFT_507772, partial [Wilcoxina mikolae CBS 423.85]